MKKYLLLLLAICSIAVPLYSFAISNPTAFSVASTSTGIYAAWMNPTDLDFYQTLLVRSNSTYTTGTLDGTIVTSGTSIIYVDTGLSDGVYYYSLFAQDLSGNLSTPATGSAIVDTTVPSIISTTPTGGQLVPGNVPFNWTISDANLQGGNIYMRIAGDPGLAFLAYQNGFTLSDSSTTQSITGYVSLWDGLYYRGSRITDEFGNQTIVSSVQFEVDATAPTLTYTSPIANGGYIVSGASATLTIESYDTHLSGGHIHALIGTTPDFDVTRPTGGLYHGGNTPYDTTGAGGITVSNLPVGTYYWYAWVTDIVGNYTSGAMQSFTVLASAPNHGGGGGSISTDNCNGTDLSPSFYDGLCLADTGITKTQRQALLTSYSSGVLASDAGATVTIAGFIRDIFALLGIPFHGTMPDSYTNTPVPEKLFAKIVARLGVLFK